VTPDFTAFLEALAFPTAWYDDEGALRAANAAFHAVIAQAAPEDEGCHATLDGLSTALALPLKQLKPGKSVEAGCGGGRIVAFTMTPVAGGGWTLCAEDVTERRQAERKTERSQKIAIIALADLAENRDNETGEHVLRVARMTHDIAMRLRSEKLESHPVDDRFLRHVGVASILHDVGKVAIPDNILLKPGPLTPEERALMERHATKGGAILRKADAMLAGSSQFKLAAEIAEFHHERWNGKGYPHGLAGETIPLGARIVAVADVLDALTSTRPYKVAWPQEKALDFIRERAGQDFDPVVVEAMDHVIATRARTTSIEWTQAMAVGEASIDHDHRILLALVNQIWCPGTVDDPIAVEFVLDELLGYTAFHFAREEELMAQAHYPDLEEHKATHKAMIEEVRKLQRRLTSFTPNLGMDLQTFLADWLTHHILSEDRRYIPYLRAGHVEGDEG
jgi:hemerythrin-like metal-binding domain